jgi:hypothetical protein
MNASNTKLAVAISVSLAVVGAAGWYLSTSKKEKVAKKKTEKPPATQVPDGKPPRMPGTPSTGTPSTGTPSTGSSGGGFSGAAVWNEGLRTSAKSIAKSEWEKKGKPSWYDDPKSIVEISNSVAKKLFPNSPETSSDQWPKSIAISEQWIKDGNMTPPKRTASVAWGKIFDITLREMGYQVIS